MPNGLVDSHDQFVCQNIHLESHELFSQLQTITSLVKIGPRRGLFLSSVNISDSIMRIWRQWLAERSKSEGEGSSEGDKERKERLVWADNNRTVGLRVRVVEREEATPVLVRKDEDPPVSYTLQYEGMSFPLRGRDVQLRKAELVIKATQLLLMVEQSVDQEVSHSGKAIVIGSWDQ